MATYKTYTVVRGDTLSHIALRYGTTVVIWRN
jgi:LysM repeat protein